MHRGHLVSDVVGQVAVVVFQTIETADIALMADDPDRIPYAIGLSKATRANVKQNVGLAVLTVGLLLVGVLGSVVQLAGGMLVHEDSVLLVIGNGMRLLRY